MPHASRPLAETDILVDSANQKDIIHHPPDPKRIEDQPRIFSGPIASANTLLKNAVERDALQDKFGVKAVEMEGSGIADATWNHEKGYLVVRGICDYCDINKNDVWQEYAAVVAAAYTRALLESMPAPVIPTTSANTDSISSAETIKANLAVIRRLLNKAFDDPGLDAFCQSHFYQVYNTFGRGMRKDEKFTLLLDHCLRLPTGFDKLLHAVRSEYELSGFQRAELKPLLDALEALPRAEDGYIILDNDTLPSPLSEVDPNILDHLDTPTGTVRPRSKFYIERKADAILQHEVVEVKEGTTTTIRGPRQVGKSSLLIRGIHHARQKGAKAVVLNLQGLGSEQLASPDIFLRELAEHMVRKLRLDVAEVERFWQGSLGPHSKLTYLVEDYILAEVDAPIILALDEVDCLLQTPHAKDFFAMLRAWHEKRPLEEVWDRLNLVMIISTEPYMLISNAMQSPFNVGTIIYLEDFKEEQVDELNRRHGAPVPGPDFSEMMNLLSGHPYLTRQSLYTLVTEHLNWADLKRFASTEQGPFREHLWHYYDLLRQDQRLKTALKEVIRDNRCSDEMALVRLLRAGLVKGRGDVYTCRCGLYRRYFADKL